MSNAVTNAPTHSAGAGCAFKSLGARDCYAKTLEQFDESVHSEELIESYKKSDQIVRLCYGKMAMGAPLLLSVFPDRREQHKLDRSAEPNVFVKVMLYPHGPNCNNMMNPNLCFK
eukprot:36796_1